MSAGKTLDERSWNCSWHFLSGKSQNFSRLKVSHHNGMLSRGSRRLLGPILPCCCPVYNRAGVFPKFELVESGEHLTGSENLMSLVSVKYSIRLRDPYVRWNVFRIIHSWMRIILGTVLVEFLVSSTSIPGNLKNVRGLYQNFWVQKKPHPILIVLLISCFQS